MRIQAGQTAVVTGASDGIGRAVSLHLAERGCRVALVDVKEAGLAETATLIARRGQEESSIHVTDVSDRVQMERLAESVAERYGGVQILLNNAGVALAGLFETCCVDDMEWVLRVNFWGVVYGCRFFLPLLRCAPCAHVVNVSSDFGLIGFPTKTAYCASKFALRGFTEGLRAELAGSSIGVTCVYPGAVDTGLIRNGRATDAAKKEQEAEFVARRSLSVDHVARRILRGIERNAGRVLIGRDTYAIDLMTRLFPSLTSRLVARFYRRLPFT